MREFIITDNEAGQRFDKYLTKLLKNAGTGLIYKQLRVKNITLNRSKAKGSEILGMGDAVQIYMADATIDKFMGTHIIPPEKKTHRKLKVVYEDDNIIIADKEAGMLSQKSAPEDYSMNELLLDYLRETGQADIITHTFTPAFCNRLDRNTSGLMVGGKSLAGLQKMSEIIKNHTADKYYLAVAVGRIKTSGRLKGYIHKDKALNKVSVNAFPSDGDMFIDTEYEPVDFTSVCGITDDRLPYSDITLTLVKVRLITGKTHQIRAHLSSMGYPILGDIKYGTGFSVRLSKSLNVKRQLLHSYELIFPQLCGRFENISGMKVRSGYPEDFKRFFKWQIQED